MKKFIVAVALAGAVCSVFATESRIIALGRHDAFFMDDYSIFRNPANLSVYPNMLFGSPGVYIQKDDDTTIAGKQYAALQRTNRDPKDPYAGGIISYSFNQSSEAGSQFPMLSIGVCVNRPDKALAYVMRGTSKFNEVFDSSLMYTLPPPIGKMDLMVGYALGNGGMFGLGTYIAMQKSHDAGSMQQASVYNINGGVNWPVAKSADVEASAGISMLTAKALDSDSNDATLADFSSTNDFVLNIDGRLFTALTLINGDLVPHVGIEYAKIAQWYEGTDVNLGVGVNINVDKGFGWGGLEFLYKSRLYDSRSSYNNPARLSNHYYGGRLSFGFERNLVWDWFLFRAGVQKELLLKTQGATDDNPEWVQNPEGDASDNDLIGVGFGLNIENRLKVDFIVAEDLFYTLTNLISGPQHHIFPRFSMSYSF